MVTVVYKNLRAVKQKIADIVEQSPYVHREVTLVAVSKNKSVRLIQAAISAGQYQFAENYAQELLTKITHFRKLKMNHPLVWHFIGSLQSNKTKIVATYCDWVHTVDRLKIAKRLSAQRSGTSKPINVLIQANIDDEKQKSGIHPRDLPNMAKFVYCLPNIRLRGLMVMGAAGSDPQKQRATFTRAFQLYMDLKKQYPDVDTLSMGMSDDMKEAIMAGSTMVRIGSAVFGRRQFDDSL